MLTLVFCVNLQIQTSRQQPAAMECQGFEKDARQGAIREQVVTKAHCVPNKYLLNTYCVPEIV